MGGSMHNMNKKVQENRESLKSADHSQSYLKGNSIKRNRRSSAKAILGGSLGLAMAIAIVFIGYKAVSNYSKYENKLNTTIVVEPNTAAYGQFMDEADSNMIQLNYEGALQNYKDALDEIPDDSIAQTGLMRVVDLLKN